MNTLKSTSILALIIARNPYHIISIQGSMPMSHAQNTYEFEIAEDDPNYKEISDSSLEMLGYILIPIRNPRTRPNGNPKSNGLAQRRR